MRGISYLSMFAGAAIMAAAYEYNMSITLTILAYILAVSILEFIIVGE